MVKEEEEEKEKEKEKGEGEEMTGTDEQTGADLEAKLEALYTLTFVCVLLILTNQHENIVLMHNHPFYVCILFFVQLAEQRR
jgi:hypothetical protein